MTSGVKLSGEGLAKIVTTLRAEFKDMLKGEEFKDLMKEGIKDVIVTLSRTEPTRGTAAARKPP